jgi:hypothetical protein
MLYALYRRWKMDNERRDFRSAQITAAVYNSIPKKPGSKWFTAKDFMPQTQKPAVQLSVDETVNYVATLNALFGGADLRPTTSG